MSGIDAVGGRGEAVRLQKTRTYLDRSRRPYVHLVDGGLIDNLGLRVAIDFAVEQGGFVELVDALGYHDLTHVVFISVNAETDPKYAIRFNSIPTALSLDRSTVDSLRAIAHKLLLESPDFKRLVADLGAK